MKYLKKFNESNDILNIALEDIKEVFYSLSDRYYIRFTKLYKPYYDVDSIMIVINSEEENPYYDKLIDHNDIKEDLEFVIDYITKELGLSLITFNIYDEGNIKYNWLDGIKTDMKQINLIFKI